MIDIIFIILVFFVFLIGVNKYENFENDTTTEPDLHQTSQIKTVTGLLDKSTIDIVEDVKTIKGKFTGAIDQITQKKNSIEGCIGCVKYCGKEPYWCHNCCDGPRYPCNWGCTKKKLGKCVRWGHRSTCPSKKGCEKWRDKCGPNLPKWKCSEGTPSDFSTPSPPTRWTGISERSC